MITTDIAVPVPGSGKRRVVVAVCAAIISFLAYSSVYAFRKPFTVASFGGIKYWNISYQSLLIISQVTGYVLSKFYGIKFIAELKRWGRFRTSLILVGVAWISLFFFALVAGPYGMIFLFVNGFALGFMWGIIFSYVEGRRATDFIGAVMAISFIFAGGLTRSVAKWMMLEWNVSENWMPFMTGLVFAFPLLFFLWLLEKIPAPDEVDVMERTVRLPMNRESRKRFIKTFGTGLAVVTITYVALTIMRDLRDNYMSNIWTELGYGTDYSIFTRTETTTSLVILGVMALLVLIKKNDRALSLVHFVIATGLLLAGVASFLFVYEKMNGALWMQLTGLGLYMGYIPFNCIFFERMIASFRVAGNAGFLIYFADAFGYLGSMIVMLCKEFMNLDTNWSGFYSHGVIVGAAVGFAGIMFSLLYFNKKLDKIKTQ